MIAEYLIEGQLMKQYVGSIEDQTIANNNFRKVLFTGEHEQLVVMALKPGEEIGSETHPDTDQFFRIEQGTARFLIGQKTQTIGNGGAALIPAGTKHNVINASQTQPLKLYTIYAPPQHPPGTIHKTKADAERAG